MSMCIEPTVSGTVPSTLTDFQCLCGVEEGNFLSFKVKLPVIPAKMVLLGNREL